MGLVEFLVSAVAIVLVPAHWLASRKRALATQLELSRLTRNVARLGVAVEAFLPRAHVMASMAGRSADLRTNASTGRGLAARHTETAWAQEEFEEPFLQAVRYVSTNERSAYIVSLKHLRREVSGRRRTKVIIGGNSLRRSVFKAPATVTEAKTSDFWTEYNQSSGIPNGWFPTSGNA
jgi:hypothetical protein